MRKEDINAFLNAIAETPELWRSVDCRAIAVRVRGEWENLVCRCRLDPRAPEDVPLSKELPRIESLVTLQQVFPLDRLPRLIAGVRRGALEIGGVHVRFRGGRHPNEFTETYGSSSSSAGLILDDSCRGPYERGHSLTLVGESSSEIYQQFRRGREELDVSLRNVGWEGLDGVLLYGLGETEGIQPTSRRRISFVAPLEVALIPAECVLRNGDLSWTIRAGSKSAGQAATLFISGENEGGDRLFRILPLSRRHWKRDKYGFRCSGTVRLAKARKLNLTVQLADYVLDRLPLKDQSEYPPLLLTAHEVLFPALRPFHEHLLTPKSTEGAEFERAVFRLFTYCGLAADQLGDIPKKQNAPDGLVAVPERNLLLVVEATVGTLTNNGKLARLVKRAGDLRVGATRPDLQVLPVMVVSSPREVVPASEMDTAKADGVRVLAREDLDALLRMALRRESPRKVAHYIVPEPSTASALWFLRDRNPLV